MANRYRGPNTRTKAKVLKRDGYRCRCCGDFKHVKPLHAHHVTPHGHGGNNTQNNLITLCEWCHTKFHKGIVDIILVYRTDLNVLCVFKSPRRNAGISNCGTVNVLTN